MAPFCYWPLKNRWDGYNPESYSRRFWKVFRVFSSHMYRKSVWKDHKFPEQWTSIAKAYIDSSSQKVLLWIFKSSYYYFPISGFWFHSNWLRDGSQKSFHLIWTWIPPVVTIKTFCYFEFSFQIYSLFFILKGIF